MIDDFISLYLYAFIWLLAYSIFLLVPVSAQWYGSQSNYISYNGRSYSLLSNLPVDGTTLYCQSNFIELPVNWVVAPDNQDTQFIVGAYRWSTHVVVLANGYGYYSANYASEGASTSATTLWGSRSLCSSSSSYYPCGNCNQQVKIQSSCYLCILSLNKLHLEDFFKTDIKLYMIILLINFIVNHFSFLILYLYNYNVGFDNVYAYGPALQYYYVQWQGIWHPR